ncbi:MAG: hypothetical protein Q8L78_06225 [Coxiellaceae bacterium]|nr:hypothetical protein [Coxiellaceae bacterium]
MFKRLLILSVLLTVSIGCFADALWHCTATNTGGAVWNWYGKSQQETKKTIQKLCTEQNNRHTCVMVCFPPKVYYRCYSHDTLPNEAAKDPTTSTPKQGTWYWSSFSKQIAMNGARDACRHNSPYGGCVVNENQCAAS